MRFSRLLGSLAFVVSVASVAGCSSAMEGDTTAADALTGTVAPRTGLYTGETVSFEDSCGLGPWLDRAYVVKAGAGYSTSYVAPDSNFQRTFALSLAGTTATNEGTQTIALSGGTTISIEMKMVDVWESATSFVRRAEESYSCDGPGCAHAPRTLGITGELPCSAAKVTAYALARCDAYPFRQVYDEGITSVWVSGTFNNWARTPAEGALVMQQGEGGLWTLDAKLPPPRDGTHLYKFIKNRSSFWTEDAANPLSVADGQSGENSVLSCQ